MQIRNWIMHAAAACLLLPTLVLAEATVERLPNGVVVRPKDAAAADVRLEVVTDRILRVSADVDGDFARTPSLMRSKDTLPHAAFTIEQGADTVRIKAKSVSAEIALDDGRVRFFDAKQRPLLAESAGGRSFSPLSVEGREYASVRQRFESPDDEAFYGTGMHQQGWMNLKGRDVELLQGNIDKAIPYLVSSRNYGVLWDNNAITRYGDPRGLRPLSESLQLFDADGKEGALSARYTFDGRERAARRESEINYQYIKDYATFPAEARNKAAGGRTLATWNGAIAARSDGRHTFSLYSSEYARLWVDDTLVIDRWRQNWNPWHHEFALEMKAGEKRRLRLEWDMIDPSYIALLHRDPLPAAEARDLSIWSEAAQMIDYYVVAGTDADAVIAGYRELTGKAQLLPKWAYGFWQSRERYKSQDELLGALDGYRKRKLPIDNIVLDWSYWPVDAWGSHQFDPKFFPDPKKMVDAVHANHAQIMVSVWPKFYPETAHYKELDAAGFMYKRNVEVGERDWIGKGYLSSFYDPYSAPAQDMFWRQMAETVGSHGFDAWWLDADEPDLHGNLDIGERKARTTPTALGPSTEFFNSYPLVHAEGVARGWSTAHPDRRGFILSRAAFAGQQRTGSGFWSGDIVPRWDDLREQISGLVNASMAGVPNVSFDIGGFAPEQRYIEKDPAHLAEWRELNLRWFQYGAFVPLFRAHGQFPYRELWELAPEGSPHYASLVHYLKLRYTLMPYIYSLAGDSYHKDGTLLRTLAMDFPADAQARDVADAYLFGPAFLVNPVSEFKATTRSVYLPAGSSWIDFDSGTRYAGGQRIVASAPLARMPLFVRAGSIVPRAPVHQHVDEQLDAPLTIEVYTGGDGRFSLYEDDGRNLGYTRGEFSRIPLEWNEAAGELRIGAREGAYPGMQQHRELRVRWIDGPRADAGALEPEADSSLRYSGDALVVKRKPAA